MYPHLCSSMPSFPFSSLYEVLVHCRSSSLLKNLTFFFSLQRLVCTVLLEENFVKNVTL